LALALALGAPGPAPAEEAVGAPCVHTAVLEPGDAGAQALYEGLRLGLERARWERVCEELPGADAAVRSAFAQAWAPRVAAAVAAGGTRPWLFLVGAALPAEAEAQVAAVPHVVARMGYAVGGRPLGPVPTAGRLRGVVLGLVEAADVGERLRAWSGRDRPRVLWRGAGTPEEVAAFLDAAGLERVDPRDPHKPGAGLRFDAVLHLRLAGEPRASFADALAAARAGGCPLVSDDRARFGQGAAFVLVPDHELLGRVAADVARRLALEGGSLEDAERHVPGMRTWIDLEACDRQGLNVLRRGRAVESPR
jgi:hypothetical protein